MRNPLTLVGVIGLALVAGCTVKKTEAPPLAGPSEYAIGLSLQAVPDSIIQDGSSQSVIVIEAHGPQNTPIRALPMRAEIRVDGVVQDFGALSTKTTVTGDDGRARIVYTAPPAPNVAQRAGSIVTIVVVPIGSDYRGETNRTVDIRLVPQGVIGPINPGLVSSFSMTPSPATAFTAVNFDASNSTDGGVKCGAACSYAWNFGDNSTGSGLTATHQYRSVGNFLVSLTVTDARGATATSSQVLVVGAGTPPTATFRFSPSTPGVSQDVFFTAEESKAAPGRNIVSYGWSFGNGQSGSGVTATARYDTAGTYTVILTVTDDAEQKSTEQKQVAIGGGGPTAVLSLSPTSGITTATNIFFDGTASTGTSPIATYEFNYGDGIIESASEGRQSHKYAAAGTYLVRLTVTDALGRKGTVTTSVTVN